jgi:hypothetical protein
MGCLKQDRWYLYTLPQPRTRQTSDQTLEILMQELDTRAMDVFTKKCCQDGAQATRVRECVVVDLV